MANEKIYTQLDMNNRIRRELAEEQEKHDASVSQLHSEIRDLKEQCQRKDSIIKTSLDTIVNLSKKGN